VFFLPKVTTGYQILNKGVKMPRKANKTVFSKKFGHHWLPLVKNLTIFYIILPKRTSGYQSRKNKRKKNQKRKIKYIYLGCWLKGIWVLGL